MRLIVFAFLLAIPITAQSAEILNFPKPRAAMARPAGIDANCQEWTDACRVCTAGDKGGAACSNIGIACLPQKWRCARP
jgi:hypothetical protein